MHGSEIKPAFALICLSKKMASNVAGRPCSRGVVTPSGLNIVTSLIIVKEHQASLFLILPLTPPPLPPSLLHYLAAGFCFVFSLSAAAPLLPSVSRSQTPPICLCVHCPSAGLPLRCVSFVLGGGGVGGGGTGSGSGIEALKSELQRLLRNFNSAACCCWC